VGLVQRDHQSVEAVAEGAVPDAVGEPVRDEPGEHFGGGVHAREVHLVVEVAVAQLAHHGAQRLRCAADVDHDAVGVERRAAERRVDDVGRAVQALRRAEDRAAQAVGDHHVVADRHAEHRGYAPS